MSIVASTQWDGDVVFSITHFKKKKYLETKIKGKIEDR